MPTYKFWYKKIIKADNLNTAIRQEKKHKIEFDSIVKDDDETNSGASAIGFEYYPDEE
jgi:hypothetical protein